MRTTSRSRWMRRLKGVGEESSGSRVSSMAMAAAASDRGLQVGTSGTCGEFDGCRRCGFRLRRRSRGLMRVTRTPWVSEEPAIHATMRLAGSAEGQLPTLTTGTPTCGQGSRFGRSDGASPTDGEGVGECSAAARTARRRSRDSFPPAADQLAKFGGGQLWSRLESGRFDALKRVEVAVRSTLLRGVFEFIRAYRSVTIHNCRPNRQKSWVPLP